uniref:Acetylcholinesterase n=1 Tax=Globodera rostochiensis TaxID=31243 RepID=A0A914HHN0_GLORO
MVGPKPLQNPDSPILLTPPNAPAAEHFVAPSHHHQIRRFAPGNILEVKIAHGTNALHRMRKRRRKDEQHQQQQRQKKDVEDVSAAVPSVRRFTFYQQKSTAAAVFCLPAGRHFVAFVLLSSFVLLCLCDGTGAIVTSSKRHRLGAETAPAASATTTVLVDEPPLVVTKLGKIRGFNQKFGGKTVHTFLGIPYARKPTGALRFAIPQMIDPWEGELEAISPARTCFYPIDTMFPDFPGAEMWNPPNDLDEDCLAMNIWVPEEHDGTVMVWIYGGGFYSGSPSLDLYDGRVLAAHERTVVVNINYRLGAFGFLYLGDGSAAPGNMGLLDQQLALQWIHEHIDQFGGNPQKVTLFGESAGGASAAAHLFAPDSHRLFRGLIAKSGAIVNNWATKPKAAIRDISLRLVQRLNCSIAGGSSTGDGHHRRRRRRRHHHHHGRRRGPWRWNRAAPASDIDSVVSCISRVPAQIVQREADHISASLLLPMNFAFVPIDEDDHFFKGSLFEKLRLKEFKKDVSIMLGSVRDEGTYWLPYYLQKYGFGFNHTISPEDQYNQALVTESEYTKAFDAFLPYFGNSQLVRHALMHAYARIMPNHNHAKSVERWRDGVARFLGDYFFTCALIEFADIVSENIFGSVFMYYFIKRSSANPWPRWMGIMHGYEIEYVFGVPLRHPQPYDPKELDMEQAFSEKIMEFWGHFARTGEPIEFWPKYNRVTRKSLVLSEEIARGNSHRIYVDVHGKLCRLLEEAQAMARLTPEQRQERLSARAPPSTADVSTAAVYRLPGIATASVWHRQTPPLAASTDAKNALPITFLAFSLVTTLIIPSFCLSRTLHVP